MFDDQRGNLSSLVHVKMTCIYVIVRHQSESSCCSPKLIPSSEQQNKVRFSFVETPQAKIELFTFG